MKDAGDALTKRAKQLFDDSVTELDAATLSRLNQGRQQALEQLNKRTSPLLRWAPLGGLATAAAVALLLVQSPGVVEAPAGSSVVDMEILLSEDNLEMLEELEFFEWIDLAELDGGDSVG